MQSVEHFLADENATLELGKEVSTRFSNGGVLFLKGDLGAGKTTLVRGILRAMGYTGKVKSPTYTLVEPYHLQGHDIYHFDLYRLGDPEELEFLGIRDYFHERALCLIEWPEKARGLLPAEDGIIQLNYSASGRTAIVTTE